MATTILFGVFASFLFGAAVTVPVSKDLKSVLSSESSRYVKLNEMPVVFNSDTILSRGEDTELKKRLDRALKRTKRQVITGNHSCATGMVWFWNMCVTLEKYKELKDDDDDES